MAGAIVSSPPFHGAPRLLPKSLLHKLAKVRLFLCDVDGVLTDNSVFMDGQLEMKRFDIRDGLGLRLLQRGGLKVGWISGRVSPATEQRARELGVDFLRQGKQSKVAVIEEILHQAGLAWAEVCYMGDDLLDLGAMTRAGVAVSVPDGIEEARARAHYVTQAQGGHGAVREAVTLLLQAQDRWEPLVEEYLA
jgi:3-deoxy-D-manno-octulosonate 8-phosphate phosphatase (KDO 8-P phosphatase)